MNRHFKAWGAFFGIALLGVSLGATAQPRKELREERKELREERKELREDKRELREDIKDGATRKEIRDDRKEIAEGRKDVAEARKELRKTRRKEVREKWGEVVKKPEAKEELKVHGRRMARLTRARAVAEELGKKELVARIDKLIEKEKTRHQGAMDKVKGGAK